MDILSSNGTEHEQHAFQMTEMSIFDELKQSGPIVGPIIAESTKMPLEEDDFTQNTDIQTPEMNTEYNGEKEEKRKSSSSDDDGLPEAKRAMMMMSDEKKIGALRKNIRDVMDENQLDTTTLAAQREESERLARVAEQQKFIREYQRQTAVNRQYVRTQNRVLSLLQSGNTFAKITDVSSTRDPLSDDFAACTSMDITESESEGGIVVPSSGESSAIIGSDTFVVNIKKEKDMMGGGGSSSSSSDSVVAIKKPIEEVVTIEDSSSEDDCILLSDDDEEEPEPEEENEEDPTNSGLHVKDAYNVPDEHGRVVVNVGHPEGEEDIFVAPQIAKTIKPHQIGGVRFLYDNIIESTKRFKTSSGFGCILAHSMGLGKTLQVVCFCDIFLRHTNSKTVLCVMPINTLQNWVSEFNMWIPRHSNNPEELRPRQFDVYVLNDQQKTLTARAKVILKWANEGGVLLIGYELFRLLALKLMSTRKRRSAKYAHLDSLDLDSNKNLMESVHQALVKPGPDLVICDEGHRIKNAHAGISLALKQIRTRRRIVLTGYPLQNNLLEYWCMVDFVRPNYLGTRTEFCNMFERPIHNGQCSDSTPEDIKLMRYRAHVLHSLLVGFVQRRSHAVLQQTLPQKVEFVVLTRMTTFQRRLYDTFMNDIVRSKAAPNPLKAFAVCCKIWNHPDVLYNFLRKRETDLDLEIYEPEGNSETSGAAAAAATAAAAAKNKAVEGIAATTSIESSSNVDGAATSSGFASASEYMSASTPTSECASASLAGSAATSAESAFASLSSAPVPTAEPPQTNDEKEEPQGSGSVGEAPRQDDSSKTESAGDAGGLCNKSQNLYYFGNCYQNNNESLYSSECNENSYWQEANATYFVYPPVANTVAYPFKPNYVEIVNEKNFQSDYINRKESTSSEIVDLDTKEIKTIETIINMEEEEAEAENKIEAEVENNDAPSDGTSAPVSDSAKPSSKDGKPPTAESSIPIEKDIMKIKSDDGIPYEWAIDLMKGYKAGVISNSPKMEIFFCILNESICIGDRVLLFSQSLLTLNLIETFLQSNKVPGSNEFWTRGQSYFRLDGSTTSQEREKLINEFNSNFTIKLFLISTRAGSLGINLVGANRVIIFDASWNPCHDTQAVYRIYRYGQQKPCFVYRIVMDKCLEKKIYDRQIKKQGMSDRVVDECNPEAHLTLKDVTNLCHDFDEDDHENNEAFSHPLESFPDVIMRKIIEDHKSILTKQPFHHESLLVDHKEKKLSQAEKRQAHRGYEMEKKATTKQNITPGISKFQYRLVRPDGTIVNRPVASIRPMQSAKTSGNIKPAVALRSTRWIPAEVWQRQGMTAQEMTLPLDVVIPTNSSDKANIILKAGQRVMVLKSAKGIYMQLDSGKIIAIRTQNKSEQSKLEKPEVIDITEEGNGPDTNSGSKFNNVKVKTEPAEKPKVWEQKNENKKDISTFSLKKVKEENANANVKADAPKDCHMKVPETYRSNSAVYPEKKFVAAAAAANPNNPVAYSDKKLATAPNQNNPVVYPEKKFGVPVNQNNPVVYPEKKFGQSNQNNPVAYPDKKFIPVNQNNPVYPDKKFASTVNQNNSLPKMNSQYPVENHNPLQTQTQTQQQPQSQPQTNVESKVPEHFLEKSASASNFKPLPPLGKHSALVDSRKPEFNDTGHHKSLREMSGSLADGRNTFPTYNSSYPNERIPSDSSLNNVDFKSKMNAQPPMHMKYDGNQDKCLQQQKRAANEKPFQLDSYNPTCSGNMFGTLPMTPQMSVEKGNNSVYDLPQTYKVNSALSTRSSDFMPMHETPIVTEITNPMPQYPPSAQKMNETTTDHHTNLHYNTPSTSFGGNATVPSSSFMNPGRKEDVVHHRAADMHHHYSSSRDASNFAHHHPQYYGNLYERNSSLQSTTGNYETTPSYVDYSSYGSYPPHPHPHYRSHFHGNVYNTPQSAISSNPYTRWPPFMPQSSIGAEPCNAVYSTSSYAQNGTQYNQWHNQR